MKKLALLIFGLATVLQSQFAYGSCCASYFVETVQYPSGTLEIRCVTPYNYNGSIYPVPANGDYQFSSISWSGNCGSACEV